MRMRGEHALSAMIAVLILLSGLGGLAGAGGSNLKIEAKVLAVQSLDVPLWVTDYYGTDRIGEPVTTGVPIPKDLNVRSVNELEITDDSGNPVPAQFKVISRWGGTPEDSSKPIRWVLIDFQADALSNSTATYHLRRVNNGGNAQDTDLRVEEDNSYINISTGHAKFVISKDHFTLFDYVYVDSNNDGTPDRLILDNHLSGGLVLVDENNTEYLSALDKPERVFVEDEGPLRIVVRVRGNFRALNGSYFAPPLHHPPEHPYFDQPYNKSFVYYDARIYFYNDKNFVRVYLRLENNGMMGIGSEPISQTIYFKSLNFTLNHRLGGNIEIYADNFSHSLGTGDLFSLYQDWRVDVEDFAHGIYFNYTFNGTLISNGSTNPGYINVHGDYGSVALAIRHFWQNFPKEIDVNTSSVSIGLWPYDGYYPDYNKAEKLYKIRGGKYKTHEMVFRFSPRNLSDDEILQLKAFMEYPLMALAPSDYYVKARAFGIFGSYNITVDDPELQEALERYEKLQEALVYENSSENGWTIFTIRTKYPPYWEQRNQRKTWGWINVGDLVWAGGYGGIHYDWPYVMLLHYLRTGKRAFFNAGYEMATHRYDIDQYHGERVWIYHNELWYNHIQTYDSGDHCDHLRVPKLSHTWVGGPLLYYLLTGDVYSLETARENGVAIFNRYTRFSSHNYSHPGAYTVNGEEIRFETWSILNLVQLYRVTGERKYLDVAKGIGKNIILYYETYSGRRGYWGSTPFSSSSFYSDEQHFRLSMNRQLLTMFCYAIEGLLNLHYETQDREIGNLIIRMADFARKHYLFGGYYIGDKYMPLQLPYWWYKKDPNHGGHVINTIFLADLFAYAFMLTNKTEYINWARKVFRDTVFYYTVSGETPVDPGYRAIISYIDNQFPGTHTKAHSWMGRCAQIYLFVEKKLRERGFTVGSDWHRVTGLRFPDTNWDEKIEDFPKKSLLNYRYIDHDPIVIYGNDDPAWDEFPGQGTADDPKIIENYSIYGGDYGCIEMHDTTLHVVIRDNYLHVANYQHGGIVIDNSTNIVVENNTITGNYMGVRVFGGSREIIIRNNTIHDNFWDDIYIKDSYNITIDGNRIYNNSGAYSYGRGIYLQNARNVSVVKNWIYNHYTKYAIYLYTSSGNKIISNAVWDNYGGILLDLSPDNEIMNNTMLNNSLSIIGDDPVYYRQIITLDNTVNSLPIHYHRDEIGLTLEGVQAWEIILYNCSATIVKDIVLEESTTGIIVANSTGTSIINSTLRNNRDYGIWLFYSNNTTINSNSVVIDDFGYDTQYGYSIYAVHSNHTRIIDSNLHGSYRGIYCVDSTWLVVDNNSITNYIDSGIYLLRCTNASIRGNTLESIGWSGIVMDRVSGSTVSGNTLRNLGAGGIELYTSLQNQIKFNKISNVSFDAVSLYLSSDNVLASNTMEVCSGSDLYLWESGNNTLYNNTMWDRGINIVGYYPKSFENSVYENNTLRGKPILFILRERNLTIDGGDFEQIFVVSSQNISFRNLSVSMGEIGFGIINSTEISVENATVASSNTGIYIMFSTKVRIEGCEILRNRFGIYIFESNKTEITESLIMNNFAWGIAVDDVSEISVWRNDFIRNSRYLISPEYYQAWASHCDGCIWNTTEGNYWSDYTYHYPQATNDGNFWDTPYSISGCGFDYLPLVSPVGSVSEPFVVLGTEPKDGDVSVDVNSSICIYFSKEVMKETVPGNISIDPAVVVDEYSWDPSGRNLTIVLGDAMIHGATYTIRINTNIMDSSGSHLAYEYTFSFQTVAENPTIYKVLGYILNDNGEAVPGASVDAFVNSVRKNNTVSLDNGYYEMLVLGYPGDTLTIRATAGGASGSNQTVLGGDADVNMNVVITVIPEFQFQCALVCVSATLLLATSLGRRGRH